MFRELFFLIVDMLIPEMEAYHKKIDGDGIEERKRHQGNGEFFILHLTVLFMQDRAS